MSNLSPCCNAEWKMVTISNPNGGASTGGGFFGNKPMASHLAVEVCSKCGKWKDGEKEFIDCELKYGHGPEVPIRKELEAMHKELSEILQILRHFDARARGTEP